MPNHQVAAPDFTSYQQILGGLTRSAMSLVEHTAAEMRVADGVERAISFDAVVRGYVVLSALIRRTILVSRYLEGRRLSAEEQAGRIMPVLDLVLTVFSQHKMSIEAYNAMIDAELDGEDDQDELDDEFDDTDRYLQREVVGRRPCILVAELCRDFGLTTLTLPAYWLDGVPAELRLLCARAAAAAIGPSAKPARAAQEVS